MSHPHSPRTWGETPLGSPGFSIGGPHFPRMWNNTTSLPGLRDAHPSFPAHVG